MRTDLVKQNKSKSLAILFGVVLAFALVLTFIGANAFATSADKQNANNAETNLLGEVNKDVNLDVNFDAKARLPEKKAAQVTEVAAEPAENAHILALTYNGSVNKYSSVANAMNAIEALPDGAQATLTLLADIKLDTTFALGYNNPNKLNLTLELDGFNFDGSGLKLTDKTNPNGYASAIDISNLVTLTVQDSSAAATGTIIGGEGSYVKDNDRGNTLNLYASGISNCGGTLNIKSGTIKNCKLDFDYIAYIDDNYTYFDAVNVCGAAVCCVTYNGSHPTLNITGGTITDSGISTKYSTDNHCYSKLYGAGVFCNNAASVNIDKATIKNGTISTAKTDYNSKITANGAGVFLFKCAGDENEISNTTITNNKFDIQGYNLEDTSSNDVGGAGIFINGVTITLDTVEISKNTGSVFGGGLYSYAYRVNEESSKIDLDNVTITENTAHSGGGMYLGNYTRGEDEVLTCNFNSGTISNNEAVSEDFDLTGNHYSTAVGGGVCCHSESIRVRFNMNGGEISNNKVVATVSANSELRGSYAYGGGVYLQSDSTQMIGVKVSGNTVLADTQNNFGAAKAAGGGIHAEDTNLKVYSSEINDNSATAKNVSSDDENGRGSTTNGGGIYVGLKEYTGYPKCELGETSISGNTANAESVNNWALVYGGGISNMYCESLRIGTNCEINNNQANAKSTSKTCNAYAYGGGIENYGGDNSRVETPSWLIINGATVKGNKLTATSPNSDYAVCYGAGIDVNSIAKEYAGLYADGAVIEENESTATSGLYGVTVGGGVFVNRDAIIANATIQKNIADFGGGIYYKNEEAAPICLYSDTIVDNTSYGMTDYQGKYYQGGAGVYAYDATEEENAPHSTLVELGGNMQIHGNTNVNSAEKTSIASNLVLESIDGESKLVQFNKNIPMSDESLVNLDIVFYEDEYIVEYPFIISTTAYKDVEKNFVYDGKEHYLTVNEDYELRLGEGVAADSEFFIASAINLSSGLDIAGGSTDSQANVQLYNSNNSGAQKFIVQVADNNYYYIKNAQSGKYLDVCGGNAANGANIWQYDFNGSDAQKFKIVKNVTSESQYATFTFKSALNENMVIDISGANTADGTNVQLWEANGTKAQAFYALNFDPNVASSNVEIDPNEDYYITLSADDNAVVDVEGASTDNGANVRVYHLTKGDKNLMYKLVPVTLNSKTFYRLVNQNSKKDLSATGGNIAPTTNVIQWQTEEANDQLWSVHQNADGTFTFMNVANAMVMDVAGGDTADFTNIWTYLPNGSDAQKFNLKPVTETHTVKFENKQGIADVTDVEGKSLSTTVTVREGQSLSFKVVAEKYWEVDSVVVDGKELTAKEGVYTIDNVGADVTVTTKAKQQLGNLTFTAVNTYTYIYVQFEKGEWEYSTDNGENWIPGDNDGTSICLEKIGDSVQLKGSGCYSSYDHHITFSDYNNDAINIEASGSVQSLDNNSDTVDDYQWQYLFYSENRRYIYGGEDKGLLTPPALPATHLGEGAYEGMFYGCLNLKEAPQLPATDIAKSCYEDMFRYCESLIKAPELPATSLAESCYESMFYYCECLTQAPELPATVLAPSCYEYMFYECYELLNAPELPAKVTAASCYEGMFMGCESLTVAPELPAKVITASCYQYMFADSGLVEPPELPATSLSFSCYNSMFSFCETLKYAPELPALILAERCYNDMFHGCDALSVAPELPATYLYDYCYSGMFMDCSNLVSAPELPAEYLAEGCYAHMFKGSNITEAPALPASDLKSFCYQSMFAYTSVRIAPELNATKLAENCYHDMFEACNKLKTVPSLEAVEVAEHSCDAMFAGCVNLVNVPDLKAEVLKDGCYKWMFYNCDSLIIPPVISAKYVADNCCYGMFQNCDLLIETPVLNAQGPEEDMTCGYCYCQMFSYCPSLVKVNPIALEISDDANIGYNQFEYMFYYCTSLCVTSSDTKPAENCFLHIGNVNNPPSYYDEMFYGIGDAPTVEPNKYYSWYVDLP